MLAHLWVYILCKKWFSGCDLTNESGPAALYYKPLQTYIIKLRVARTTPLNWRLDSIVWARLNKRGLAQGTAPRSQLQALISKLQAESSILQSASSKLQVLSRWRRLMSIGRLPVPVVPGAEYLAYRTSDHSVGHLQLHESGAAQIFLVCDYNFNDVGRT